MSSYWKGGIVNLAVTGDVTVYTGAVTGNVSVYNEKLLEMLLFTLSMQ